MSAGRSSCAWRTPTRPARPSSSSATSWSTCTGSASSGTRARRPAGARSAEPSVPYRQMARLPLYADAAAGSWQQDRAYPCYCSAEELEADRKAQEAAKLPSRYVGRCATLTPEERAARVADGRRPRHPVPDRAGRRRLRRPRPGPRRDRRRRARRRPRDPPGRRHSALPLHGGRRRRGDGDHPRHPRRGPPVQHAQAHPPLPGPGPSRAASSPTCRSSSTRTGRR